MNINLLSNIYVLDSREIYKSMFIMKDTIGIDKNTGTNEQNSVAIG